MPDQRHRDRVLRALNHEEADRVPIDLGGTAATVMTIQAWERLRQHLGLPPDTPVQWTRRESQTVWPAEAALQILDTDVRGLTLGLPRGWQDVEIDDPNFFHTFRDEWGTVWSRPEDGHYITISGPFSAIDEPTPADLDRYQWPDPADPGWYDGLRERALHLRESTGCAVCLTMPRGVMGRSHGLRGFEQWFEDLLARPIFCSALMERITDHLVVMAEIALRQAGDVLDVAFFSDDLGIQNAPMMSPDLYRRMIKPHQQRYVDAIKRAAPHIKVLMHTDGAIVPFLPDLIEIGVDAINPVQVTAMGLEDTAWLKREYGRHLTFWGGIDSQRVMPFGTAEEVRAEVRRRIQDLAPGGGLVLANIHNIQEDVPPENVVALFAAAREFGRYPVATQDREVAPPTSQPAGR